jgi:hypothetical protein
MAPYFNVESGEMRDADLYTDAADPIAPSSDAPKPVTPKDTAASPTPALKPGWPVLDTLEKIERFRSEFMGNVYHPAHGDPELMDYYATAQWRLRARARATPRCSASSSRAARFAPLARTHSLRRHARRSRKGTRGTRRRWWRPRRKPTRMAFRRISS